MFTFRLYTHVAISYGGRQERMEAFFFIQIYLIAGILPFLETFMVKFIKLLCGRIHNPVGDTGFPWHVYQGKTYDKLYPRQGLLTSS